MLASWRDDWLPASFLGTQDTFWLSHFGLCASCCGTWRQETLLGWKPCCGADSGKQMGKILEDCDIWSSIVIYDQKCLQKENCYTSFTTSVISNQPGGEPGKCRESWAFSFLVVHSFFILALEKEQSSGLLFFSSQPRQTSLMETGSFWKESLEGVGLFSLPFILLEKRRWRTGNETGISPPE